MTDALLTRIAEALERLAPPREASADWLAFPAYVWDGKAARGIDPLEAPALDLMQGIDKQKAAVVENVARLSRGAAAHDMLLWGARGMGKSALLRAATLAAQDLPISSRSCARSTVASSFSSTISASMRPTATARASCGRGWRAAWRRDRRMSALP